MSGGWYRKKLSSMMLSASFAAAMNFIALQLDDVIIGQMINSQAVGAVGLVSPFVTFTVFVSTLITDGTISCILSEIGKLHKHRASIYFTNGLVLSVLAGLLCLIVGIAAKDIFIGSVSSDPVIYGYADTYFRYYMFAALLQPIYTYFQQVVYIEGNERVYLLSFIIAIVSNVLFSVLLLSRIGIAGAALGSALSYVIGGVFLLPHYLLEKDALHLNFRTGRNKLGNIFSNGLAASSPLVCSFALTLFLNRYFVAHYSAYRLPVLAVAENIVEMTAVFGWIGKAAAPFLALYRGEENAVYLNKVKSRSVIPGFIYSAVLTALVFVLAPEIAALFGIRDYIILRFSVKAIRIIAVSFIPTSYLMILFDYHTIIGSLPYAALISFLRLLLIPVLLVVSLSRQMGETGIWFGIASAPYAAMIFFVLPLKIGKHRLCDYFIMKNELNPNVFSFELVITPDNIIDLQQKLNLLLSEYGICRKTRNYVTLIVEEVYMLVLETNPDDDLAGECTLSIGDDILLVIKDNGKVFDVTDCDMPVSSFRSFMLSRLMESSDRTNLTTLCCNRNAFRVPIVCDVPQEQEQIIT